MINLLQSGKAFSKTFLSYSSSSNDKRIFFSNLKGDSTIEDETSDVWNWLNIDNNFRDVIGLSIDTAYTKVFNYNDMESSNGTFFYDESTFICYINLTNNTEPFNYLFVNATLFLSGFSDNIYKTTDNYFNDIFYSPRASFGDVSKSVNSLKSGLIPLSSFKYNVASGDNTERTTIIQESLGSKVNLVNEDGVFLYTGNLIELSQSRTSYSITVEDTRFFLNAPVCENNFTVANFPSIDDSYIGKPIPVAYGKIRRGICIPIDSSSFDPGTGGTLNFLVADESHGIVNISNVYDNQGNQLTPTISNNRFSIVVPANTGLSLDKLKWEGTGYNSLTNGLDIIKKTFEDQGNYFYNDFNYDTSEWDSATSANTQQVGISTQSNKTILSEIVEPITRSLFGIVDIENDGRLTWRSRDILTSTIGDIKLSSRIGSPNVKRDSKSVFSRTFFTYSNDYVESDFSFAYIDNSQEIEVINKFQKRETLEYKTVLHNESDVINLASKLNSITSDIQKIWSITTTIKAINWELYDLISIETGTIIDSEIIEVEIIEKSIDFDKKQIKLKCREV